MLKKHGSTNVERAMVIQWYNGKLLIPWCLCIPSGPSRPAPSGTQLAFPAWEDRSL